MSPRSIFILLVVLASFGCEVETEEAKLEAPKYSFFVAGHVYGNPNTPQFGLYPPFKSAIDTLNAYPSIAFGFFTGDVVNQPTKAYWDAAMTDLDRFKIPYHIAPGNHDLSQEFDKRFGKYNYSFYHENDLFIVLTANQWNIVNDSYDVLNNALDSIRPNTSNVFVFCHELLWWSPENQFKEVEMNYRPHYPGRTNFEDTVMPMIQKVDQDVYWFAGDIGCTDLVSPYMYYKEDNVHLIASGMGNGKNDNFVIVEIDENDQVKLKLIGLHNKLFNELINLDNYQLPKSN